MLHCSCLLTSGAVQAFCMAGRASWPVKLARKVHRSWESLPDLIGCDDAIRWVQASANAIALQHGTESGHKMDCLLPADGTFLIVVHQAATAVPPRVHYLCNASASHNGITAHVQLTWLQLACEPWQLLPESSPAAPALWPLLLDLGAGWLPAYFATLHCPPLQVSSLEALQSCDPSDSRQHSRHRQQPSQSRLQVTCTALRATGSPTAYLPCQCPQRPALLLSQRAS